MELKMYTPVRLKLVFEKIKFKVLHYIQHNFIRQRPEPNKDRLACSQALLLTISISNIVTHCIGHIKRDKYFFFI